MLVQNLAAELGPGRGAVVTVSVPEGRTVAARTYNPRLGVEGGISILGTRGIVVPMSEEALVATIFTELDVLAASGRTACCLVPGNYGEATARKLGVPAGALVKTSNFLGYSLEKLSRMGEEGKSGRIDHLLLVGQVGKLLKVAGGSLHTSSRYSDGRLETLASCAALAGASREEVAAILEANTADEAVNALLEKPWAAETLDRAGRRIVAVLQRSCKSLRCVGVVLFILPDRIVHTSGEVKRLLAAWERTHPPKPLRRNRPEAFRVPAKRRRKKRQNPETMREGHAQRIRARTPKKRRKDDPAMTTIRSTALSGTFRDSGARLVRRARVQRLRDDISGAAREIALHLLVLCVLALLCFGTDAASAREFPEILDLHRLPQEPLLYLSGNPATCLVDEESRKRRRRRSSKSTSRRGNAPHRPTRWKTSSGPSRPTEIARGSAKTCASALQTGWPPCGRMSGRRPSEA
jgi:hypothetical protein